MYTLRGVKPVWVGGDPSALCACVHKTDALSPHTCCHCLLELPGCRPCESFEKSDGILLN